MLNCCNALPWALSFWLCKKRVAQCCSGYNLKLCSNGSFKMWANFFAFILCRPKMTREEKKKLLESYFLLFKMLGAEEEDGDWEKNTQGVMGGETENGNEVSAKGRLKMCCLCACTCTFELVFCVKISMSANRRWGTANSPGLFTQLSEGSDTPAHRFLSLTHVLLTGSSKCLTFSFSFFPSPFSFSFTFLTFAVSSPSAGKTVVEGSVEIRALEMLVG